MTWTQSADTGPGGHYFYGHALEASLQNVDETLRPGMRGVAKIVTDDQPLLWIWTHRAVDWARYAAP